MDATLNIIAIAEQHEVDPATYKHLIAVSEKVAAQSEKELKAVTWFVPDSQRIAKDEK